jgi:arylsulfatase
LRFEGGIGKGATTALFGDGHQVADGKIPQTIRVRFSLDETFDVGEDTGTPAVEDHVDKMPFAFTDTLKKFVVIFEPDKLTPAECQALREAEAKAYMGVH